MAKLGQEVLIKFNDKLFAGITSHKGGWDRDMHETTNMNTPNKGKSFIPGRMSGDLSVDMITEEGSAEMLGYYDLLELFKVGTKATVYRGGSETGDKYEEYEAYIKSINKDDADNSIETGSITFQPEGEPEVKTVA